MKTTLFEKFIKDGIDQLILETYGRGFWWMDTNLEFHKVPTEGHREWAERYLISRHMDATTNVYDKMYKMGFVRVVKEVYGEQSFLAYQYDPVGHPLSAKQLKALKDWGIENHCQFLLDDVHRKEFPIRENTNSSIKVDEIRLEPPVDDTSSIDEALTGQKVRIHVDSRFGEKFNLEFPGLLSKNTIPGEDKYRITFFDRNNSPKGHFPLTKQEYNAVSTKGILPNTVLWTLSKSLDCNAKEISVILESIDLEELNELFDKSANLFLGFVRHDNLKVVGKNVDDESYTHHDFAKDIKVNIFNHDFLRWRYRKDLNKLYWWGMEVNPTEDEKEAVTNWLIDNLGLLQKPINVMLTFDDERNGYTRDSGYKDRYNAHSINEDMTYKQLLNLTTPERKERASNVVSRSLPVSSEKGNEQWNFRYKSTPQTTTTDKPFQGSITFFKPQVGHNDNAMDLKCKVDCGCPDYMYKFAYNNASKGAGNIGPNSLNKAINRRPKAAYDIGEGLCKHLASLRRYLQTQISTSKGSNLFETMDGIVDKGPFNITYGE